jgi:hypothetical protein
MGTSKPIFAGGALILTVAKSDCREGVRLLESDR